MKQHVIARLHGWMQSVINKWTKPIGLTVVCGAFGLALCQPMATSAAQPSTPITQLEFLQWLVQACGDSSQVTPNATAADVVQWAKNKGMNPNGGWQPNAALSRQAMAQALVQLFGINGNKYGGDYVRILEREGIALPTDAVVTRVGLVSVVDDIGFQSRTAAIARSSGSPIKGNNGVGNGEDPPPPGWQNPRNPHYGQPQNDGPGTGPGNPGSKGGRR